MNKSDLKKYLLIFTILIIGVFLSLIPNSNSILATANRLGHSFIIITLLVGIGYLTRFIFSRNLQKSVKQLLNSGSGIFISQPWKIKKEENKLMISVDKSFLIGVIIFMTTLGALLYYVLLPLDLALRKADLDLSISPAFLLGVLTVLFLVIIFVEIYVLKRNKRVIIEKGKQNIIFLRKRAKENDISADLKDQILLPTENLKDSLLKFFEYHQIVVPATNAKGDEDFIENETKETEGDYLLLIQSIKENFIKEFKQELLNFLEL